MIKEPRGRLIVAMSDDHSPAEGREMRDQLQHDNPDLAVTVMTGVTGVVYVPGDK